MGEYEKKLIYDLPDQFKDKPRISGLIRTIGRQMDDLADFYYDLNTKRWVETAEGAQLDAIGDILVLDRVEAFDIVSKVESEMTDDLYRTLLKYKIALNTSNSTYYDFMYTLRLIWSDTNVKYHEDPSRPATIILEFPDYYDIDGWDNSLNRLLTVKAAGVGILWYINYLITFDESVLEQVLIDNINFQFEIRMFNDYLLYNGKAVYDGSYLYDNKVMKDMDEAIEFHIDMRPPSMDMQVTYELIDELNCFHLDGQYLLDGSKLLNCRCKTEDLNGWYLNGEYPLDGSIMLDGYRTKEDV